MTEEPVFFEGAGKGCSVQIGIEATACFDFRAHTGQLMIDRLLVILVNGGYPRTSLITSRMM